MKVTGMRPFGWRKAAFAGFLALVVIGRLFAADGAATRRFGLFIGSNNGGRDRVLLRYAINDARAVSRVFNGMGGISEDDGILLVEPTIREINRQLDRIGNLSAQARRSSQRTELVFYYSGHSDENGILLNRESYGYRELRERINSIQADMRIVILDSCSSGAITRAKGGVKTLPFLFDSSVSAEGYAFLTSSSADEASQESDSIESSYFTHSLLAGLRGAADSVGDGRVTLNELYRFAYTETLAKTETSVYGVQHPSYDIQISGSGDVVLTDIKEISASLLFAEDLIGRISIRDSYDFLVAELTKVTSKPIELGLEPGFYRITLQQGDNFYRVELSLPENRRTTLGAKDFSMIAAASGGRLRGDEPPNAALPPSDDDVPVYNLNIQLLPGIDINGHGKEKATNHFLFGLFLAFGHNIEGLGLASLGQMNTGYVKGTQVSGLFNSVDGHINGFQTAGLFNIAGGDVHGFQAAGWFNLAGGDVRRFQSAGFFNHTGGSLLGFQAAGIFNMTGAGVQGFQAAGIFNIVKGDIRGFQAAGIFNVAEALRGMQAGLVNVNTGGKGAMFGLVNVSKSEDMVPFGLVNIIKNGILHGGVFVDDMLFTNLSFRSGNKFFYSLFSFGARGANYPGSGDSYAVARSGIGFEIPINQFFLNIDMTSGYIINVSTLGDTADSFSQMIKDSINGLYVDWGPVNTSVSHIFQLRLTGGYKFYEHLGVFAGISYDHIYRYYSSSPDARDFNGPLVGGVYGRHTHKLGFFGGIQF